MADQHQPTEPTEELDDLTPEAAAAKAWNLVTVELGRLLPDGKELEGLVNAYLNLRTVAGNARRAVEAVELAQAETRAIEHRAAAVLEEAKALGKDTFEGRLEALGVRLEDLAEVVG
jgi:hypothetical protein